MSDLVTQEWELPSPVCPGGKILQGLSSVPAPETFTSGLSCLPASPEPGPPALPWIPWAATQHVKKFLFRFK